MSAFSARSAPPPATDGVAAPSAPPRPRPSSACPTGRSYGTRASTGSSAHLRCPKLGAAGIPPAGHEALLRPSSATRVRQSDMPPAPRAMRPCSAASSRRSGKDKELVPFGITPVFASIAGGIHRSYAALGMAQQQPQLAAPGCHPRTVPPAPATPEIPPYVDSRGLEAAMHAYEAHVAAAICLEQSKESRGPPSRKLIICPHLRAHGVCRLPSCPFVHESCRSVMELKPLYAAGAPSYCCSVPCRFFDVLGTCPHGQDCAYWHRPRGQRRSPAT